MSAFEFFFSFYGLLLGLSVAVIATGVATAVQYRRSIRIGWLTPLLALFVGLDVATFWDSAWANFRHLPFSYGLLITGLAITTVYFVAASLVFPHQIQEEMSLDDHFWANKKVVLLLLVLANALSVAMLLVTNLQRDGGMRLMASYAMTFTLYLVLIVPAAYARKARLFLVGVGLHSLVYGMIAVASTMNPEQFVNDAGEVVLSRPQAPAGTTASQ